MVKKNIIQSTGRRKSSVARIRMTDGSGSIMVNGISAEDYFGTALQIEMLKLPFQEIGAVKKYDIIKIVVFNGLMLLFGYLGETGIISKYIGIPLGFLFFGLAFKVIYDNYATKTKIGYQLLSRPRLILFIQKKRRGNCISW